MISCTSVNFLVLVECQKTVRCAIFFDISCCTNFFFILGRHCELDKSTNIESFCNCFLPFMGFQCLIRGSISHYNLISTIMNIWFIYSHIPPGDKEAATLLKVGSSLYSRAFHCAQRTPPPNKLYFNISMTCYCTIYLHVRNGGGIHEHYTRAKLRKLLQNRSENWSMF